MHIEPQKLNTPTVSQSDLSPTREFQMNDLNTNTEFIPRHIGPNSKDIQAMLQTLNLKSLEELIEKSVPTAIQRKTKLNLPEPLSEKNALERIKSILSQNKVLKNYIGMGYHDTILPTVILRNVLENPSWYTQYTPYQAEISQGRLETLLNFQTLVSELTGLEIANASLLDEGTACAEAMTFCQALAPGKNRNVFFVSETCHPQSIEVVQTRAKPMGIEVIVGDYKKFEFTENVFGVLLQYPNTYGEVESLKDFAARAHANKSLVAAACDLLSLTLLTPPGEWGADVAVGNSQRFGVPMGFGGPHAAFFATKEEYKRRIPGRLVGVSVDRLGKPAIRLALQTREQHIRRDKATSNICTAQVLLANIATFYAIYHGPDGLKKIARRIHTFTAALASALQTTGHKVLNATYFDTLYVELKGITAQDLQAKAAQNNINVREISANTIGLSIDESTSVDDLQKLLALFGNAKLDLKTKSPLTAAQLRTSEYLKQDVFNVYHSETEMLRYLKRLQDKDLSLTTSMIPLGSCTMKLNATSEMIPVTWPEVSQLHPFAPLDQAKGYLTLFQELENWLADITGFDAVSLQPNAGSQGEYAGLLTIRKYFEAKKEAHRNVCLIPVSAHGTNPASAIMAGFQVVGVACDEKGNIDVPDLKVKIDQHKTNLAALMVTYPSTHGVFEESIMQICELIHAGGGQVYLDGANMNAMVGTSSPGIVGADVCHLNLHKTFCIPHGGGGPGVGPIGVRKHLAPYLPGNKLVNDDKASRFDAKNASGAISAAPWGSASILPISWMYIQMMGHEGLLKATQVAILNANYISHRLQNYYPTLYKGANGFVAHECILDLRNIKDTTGISVEDVAKRLIDYGFHAPTMSFPVVGTLMVEPTESESKAELDRFCEAMISIHGEIEAVRNGKVDKEDNVLKNAPHTAVELMSDDWKHAYTRQQAAYPQAWVQNHKFWPAVSRVDNAYGDRNLVCSCDDFFGQEK